MSQEGPITTQRVDRRKWERRELILVLHVRTPTGADLGRVGDLTLGGVQIIHQGTFSIGEEVALSIELPHSLAAGSSLHFCGVCRWTSDQQSTGKRCGIEFLDVTPEKEEILKSLIGRFVGELSWEIRFKVHKVIVHLRGALDERADLAALVAQLTPPFCFDLGDLVRIDSYGARSWTQMTLGLAKDGPIELQRCSPAFVAYLNMISGFQGPTKILSVNAPFICERCDVEYTTEIATIDGRVNLPAPTCTACGRKLTFDDIPARYFSFLIPR